MNKLLWETLIADPILTEQLNGRIYRAWLPQQVIYPAITLSHIATDPVINTTEVSDLNHEYWQLDVWAEQVNQLMEIKSQVMAVLAHITVFKALLVQAQDGGFDVQEQVYRCILEYSVWFA